MDKRRRDAAPMTQSPWNRGEKSTGLDQVTSGRTGDDAPQAPRQFALHMASAQDPSLKKLRLILTSWINAHLAQQHIVIRDIVTDLADGQLLGAFLECATGEHLNTVSSMGQKSKDATMSNVVSFLGTHLHIHEDEARWTASGIRARDISSIFVLLVALTRVLGCPYRLPSDLSIAVVRTETLDGAVKNKTTVYKLTGDESKTVPVVGGGGGGGGENGSLSLLNLAASQMQLTGGNSGFGLNADVSDAAGADGSGPGADSAADGEVQGIRDGPENLAGGDAAGEPGSLKPRRLTRRVTQTHAELPPDNLETLLNHPAKSRELESLLLNFVNRTLAPAKLRVAATTSIDGMTLILLLGSLGNFFVATSEYFPSAETTVHKIANIKCAFSLMNRFSVDLARISSQEIMKHNEKIILRCLYNIFQAHQAGAFAM